jgi:hypothetical protein
VNTLQPSPSRFPVCSHALAPSLRPISEPRHPHRPHRESVSTFRFFPISEVLDTSNRPHHPKPPHPDAMDLPPQRPDHGAEAGTLRGLPVRPAAKAQGRERSFMALTEYASKVLNRLVLHWRGLTLDELRQVMTAAAREYPWSTK